MHGGTGHTVANRGVAALILRDAGHETVKRLIRADGARLKQGRNSIAAQFIPADTRLAANSRADLHGVAGHVRLISAEIAIGETEHEAISHRVDMLSGGRRRGFGNTEGVCRSAGEIAPGSV